MKEETVGRRNKTVSASDSGGDDCARVGATTLVLLTIDDDYHDKVIGTRTRDISKRLAS